MNITKCIYYIAHHWAVLSGKGLTSYNIASDMPSRKDKDKHFRRNGAVWQDTLQRRLFWGGGGHGDSRPQRMGGT